MSTEPTIYPHVSVDCVVFGFDGNNLKVLLIERTIPDENGQQVDKKLPGSLIYNEEDLDVAANRVLNELTGLKNIYLNQFYTFSDLNRTKNPKDVFWLEDTTKLKIGRIISTGYVSLVKINRKLQFASEQTTANWYDIDMVKKSTLAFDHNQIIEKALEFIKQKVELEPRLLFELLPSKFTIFQLRKLYDTINQSVSDVRNFQKKVNQMTYLIKLDEFETGVAHRAARLYKFSPKKKTV